MSRRENIFAWVQLQQDLWGLGGIQAGAASRRKCFWISGFSLASLRREAGAGEAKLKNPTRTIASGLQTPPDRVRLGDLCLEKARSSEAPKRGKEGPM